MYREAFNHALEQYKDADKRRKDDSREAVTHKVAWSAVEKNTIKMIKDSG
ncbi:MAG: ChaB family protein [Rickettsia endosymbiont of Ixodes persulcatus]|nr:ChaB family protein [Rickettsia endosymbiont of Ixodes persulcatus]MCZ6901438.1 ChaB family protein [Rickettsia endosymbiont of Ixodes persulcatus]MCZ6903176.1 ChaB family protein [Rickettsia endosymbiont of Ixodes persulcatus]MCZ6908625.1 ChaB family protein [Rickettsia endosymbiont of Ixodes persulcatus]MCZ6910721.1 ChaB family protein [Rickettsia endosymbiont of Ixodes persulcatus]